MKNKNVQKVAMAGIIAALYVGLGFLVLNLASGVIQIRFAEVLTVMPVFTAAGIPGVTIGCFLFNLLSGAPVGDVIFGTLATLIGAVGTRLLRKQSRYLAVLPPILANTLIVPFVLRYAYGAEDAIWFMMVTVCAGEIVAAGILALLLRRLIEKNQKQIFPEGKD
ncbi:MAG: QueT transporter family protein [Lachnospiraceae bacterium]|nr:QueT transporter family protein [Lachnospiraceae bacterium]